MAYSFECEFGGKPAQVCTGRAYLSDTTARRAAMRIFNSRTTQPDDELRVFDGNVAAWFGTEPRYVGKVAYQHDGRTQAWFPA